MYVPAAFFPGDVPPGIAPDFAVGVYATEFGETGLGVLGANDAEEFT